MISAWPPSMRSSPKPSSEPKPSSSSFDVSDPAIPPVYPSRVRTKAALQVRYVPSSAFSIPSWIPTIPPAFLKPVTLTWLPTATTSSPAVPWPSTAITPPFLFQPAIPPIPIPSIPWIKRPLIPVSSDTCTTPLFPPAIPPA